jgi:Ni,Fe-hydrogenase maturation factor
MEDAAPGGGTLILGAGDAARRDLGVGLVVAEALAHEPLGDGVTVQTSGAGVDVLLAVAGWDRVLLVCATDMGAAPGAVRAFTIEDAEAELLAPLPGPGGLSLGPCPGPCLADWLELGAMTGPLPALTIIGVQPAEIAPGTGLTLPVGQAVSVAMDEVRHLLASPA